MQCKDEHSTQQERNSQVISNIFRGIGNSARTMNKKETPINIWSHGPLFFIRLLRQALSLGTLPVGTSMSVSFVFIFIFILRGDYLFGCIDLDFAPID
jgi:hypothetical protein